MPDKFCYLQIKPKLAKCISRCDISLQDILFSLFQDSVCASASQVVISTSTLDEKTWLSVTDDGEEIFENKLTKFGRSRSANKDTYFIKFSRQLSICNLLQRGAIVESKKLSLAISPGNFPISTEVQMRSSQVERGTKISFPIATGEVTQLLRVVKCLALFSPIAIVLNGSSFTRKERLLVPV